MQLFGLILALIALIGFAIVFPPIIFVYILLIGIGMMSGS